jgi:hypothetical protein
MRQSLSHHHEPCSACVIAITRTREKLEPRLNYYLYTTSFPFFFNPDSTTLALLISPWRAIHIHLVRRFFPFGVSVDSSMK